MDSFTICRLQNSCPSHDCAVHRFESRFVALHCGLFCAFFTSFGFRDTFFPSLKITLGSDSLIPFSNVFTILPIFRSSGLMNRVPILCFSIPLSLFKSTFFTYFEYMGILYSKCCTKAAHADYILDDFDIEEYDEPPDEQMSQSFVTTTTKANGLIEKAEIDIISSV